MSMMYFIWTICRMGNVFGIDDMSSMQCVWDKYLPLCILYWTNINHYAFCMGQISPIMQFALDKNVHYEYGRRLV